MFAKVAPRCVVNVHTKFFSSIHNSVPTFFSFLSSYMYYLVKTGNRTAGVARIF